MSYLHIDGVGNLAEHAGYWECEPAVLNGATLSIESDLVSQAQEDRARRICAHWPEILAQCLAYIEACRADYDLQASVFTEPGVFIESGDEWSVYFETDHEQDAVVGVNFKGSTPFQLTIGD